MHQFVLLTGVFSSLISLAASQTIDPNTVPLATRGKPPVVENVHWADLYSCKDAWCTSQITQCPLLCLQLPGENSAATESNTCDPVSQTVPCSKSLTHSS